VLSTVDRRLSAVDNTQRPALCTARSSTGRDVASRGPSALGLGVGLETRCLVSIPACHSRNSTKSPMSVQTVMS